MPEVIPPEVEQSYAHLVASLKELKDFPALDLMKASWAEIEKGIIRLLGGAFKTDNPSHQGVALGLCATLGLRLAEEQKGFWVPNREAPDGWVMGFPDAVMMLSPFAATVEALSRGNLSQLEDITLNVRKVMAEARFSGRTVSALSGQTKLDSATYQRLFDPGFIQFVTMDGKKLQDVWESRVAKVASELRDAVSGAAKELPQEVRQSFQSQLNGSLDRLSADATLIVQVDKAPRTIEAMSNVFATLSGTGCAPEEFWAEIVLPLLFIGNPLTFPPLGKEETDALSKGVDPLLLFIDSVPYQTPAPDEGILGVFAASEIQVPHPSFSRVGVVRLIKVDSQRLAPLLEAFEVMETRKAIAGFVESAKVSVPPTPAESEGNRLLEAAAVLLTDLKKLVASIKADPTGNTQLYLRRITEGEAMSEPAMALVRKNLNRPRIILTG